MKLDVIMRILGSVGVVTAYFVVLHINTVMGAAIHLVADVISLPYFIRTKSWDVVIMLCFILSISMSKIIA